ncbi:MAG: isochorismatase family protein [Actinobacteria bacterium]|nr:isochorismatase family protein [Actinomycetota bacterium]
MTGPDTEEIYERAGWGGRVPRGTRPAILVVDLSRGFTEPEFPTGADLTDVVAATSRLVEAAHATGAPVLFTTIAYEESDLAGGCAWLRKAPGMGILRAGSELVDLDPRLPRRPADALVVKKGPSAFFGTDVAASLVAQGVDTVLVCGATTSGCVRASVVDAVQYGFTVLVPRPAVGDRAAGPHEANLFDIDAKYADVIDLDDALAYVAAPAGEAPGR